MADDYADWNRNVIEEFRANKGKVGGDFEGKPLLILRHTGAKSGEPRENPLMYQQVNGGWAIFASKGGAPDSPAWYHNLQADPNASIEVGDETIDVTARVAGPEEREPIWRAQKERFPMFGE